MDFIYCLMFTGHGLTEEVLWKLFFTAQEMFKKGNEKLSFKDDWCEGIMTTAWEIRGLGDVYGYRFIATVEWGDKKTEVKFIARKTDLGRDDLKIVSLSELLNPQNLN